MCAAVVCAQVLPFDSRVLQSDSHEIILRHLDCPSLSPDSRDRIDQLLAYYAAHLPSASSPSALTPLTQIGRMLLASLKRGAAGGTEGALVKDLGEYAQVVQELRRTQGRVQALDATSAEAGVEAKAAVQGKRNRVAGSMQRLVKREGELRRALTQRLQTSPLTSAPAASSPAGLIAVSPSPSTALVVQLLQAMSALCISASDQAMYDAAAAAHSLLPVSPASSSDAADSSAAVFPVIPPSPPLQLPYPPASYYLAKHLLSQTQLPLREECVLERELFIKSAGKALQYNRIA